MTHHAPAGAWASLTFGLPGGGLGIEMEALGVQASGDLLVACSHGAGRTVVLPFYTAENSEDYEGRIAGNAVPKAFRSWSSVPTAELERTLTPSVDEFAGANIRFRVTSPRAPLSLAHGGDVEAQAIIPALLLEVDIDNTGSAEPATGFLGLAYKGAGRIRPLDWATPGLAGVGYQDRWALAAQAGADVFTIRSGSVAPFVESGQPVIHPGGNEGGIGFRVAPGAKRTLTAVFGFYRGGNAVAQGLDASYAYTRDFAGIEQVCSAALASAEVLHDAAREFDGRLTPADADPVSVALLAQATQGYYANASLLRDVRGALHWSVCEGQFAWRNTLDLAVDQLPFELVAHPTVALNVIDGFIERYSYRDLVRFDGETQAVHPGGISFTHDQGNYTAYSPAGTSGYEQPDREGVYSFMTTEQLLNGVYCIAGCALKAGDAAWSRDRMTVGRELIASLENREHFDPVRRDGILRGQSERVGKGQEITTYDALDHALQNSRGSLYIVVKTWCAAVMLERWFASAGDDAEARRATALASRAAASLTACFDRNKNAFPANLLDGGESLVIAALDPLALPLFCGLETELRRFPELIECLRAHARSCLKPGACIDETSGGLRLSSTAVNTWPSKVALTFAALGWLEQSPPAQVAPAAFTQLALWMQVSAARMTVSDQINVATGQQIGGAYYPRLVTLQAFFPAPL